MYMRDKGTCSKKNYRIRKREEEREAEMKWVRKRVKMAPRSDREIRNIWTDPLKCCNIRISVKVCNHVR